MDTNLRSLQAVRALIRYLEQHPHASDTLEGIHRWWLQPGASISALDIAEALAWLHEQAAIEMRAAADGRVRYRRAERFDTSALLELAARRFGGSTG
jgi:hypothetical protein